MWLNGSINHLEKHYRPSDECDWFQFNSVYIQFQFQAVNLCSSSSSSSSKLFVYFYLQFQFQAKLVKTSQPDGIRYFIISCMLEVKEHLTTVFRRVSGKTTTWLNGSINSPWNITKTLCPSDECDQFQVISVCRSSFSSSSKLLIRVNLVVVPNCSSISSLVLVTSLVSKKLPNPVGNLYFQSHVISLK